MIDELETIKELKRLRRLIDVGRFCEAYILADRMIEQREAKVAEFEEEMFEQMRERILEEIEAEASQVEALTQKLFLGALFSHTGSEGQPRSNRGRGADLPGLRRSRTGAACCRGWSC